MNRAHRACLMASLLAALCAPVLAAPYVEMPNNKFEGTAIRVLANGDVILTMADGQRTFTKGSFVRAVADKPAEFDKARQLAAAGKYAEAETLLKEIIAKLAGLEWDNASRIVLGREVYIQKGEPQAAVAIFEELLRVSPDRKNSPEVMWSYRAALVAAKQTEKLLPNLNELIAGGSREDAAKAYVMRGDIKLAQQQVEPAALDYLRAAILFENEQDVQPEALYKAAQTLEKLRDPKAAALRAKLKERYPSYAPKAGGR